MNVKIWKNGSSPLLIGTIYSLHPQQHEHIWRIPRIHRETIVNSSRIQVKLSHSSTSPGSN